MAAALVSSPCPDRSALPPSPSSRVLPLASPSRSRSPRVPNLVGTSRPPSIRRPVLPIDSVRSRRCVGEVPYRSTSEGGAVRESERGDRMRPVFCGNFDFDARQSDLERIFSKYGPIRRIDMKSGYAFIYFEDERDGEDAIRELDQADFGHSRRRLSVEWSRQEEPVAKNRDRPTGDAKPTKTLFVINFDPIRTKIRDIERHFEPYGKISNIRIRKNFAFVRYGTLEEASAAVKKTDKSTILDRVVTVEYAFRDDDSDRDDRYGASKRGDDTYGSPKRGDDRYGAPKRGDDRYGSPRRGDDRYGSPRRADQGRRRDDPYTRSPSPRYRRDYSPDYDRRPRNPGYDRRDGATYGRNRSPVYDRYDRGRSPGYGRY